jgi:hypothetical protein
MTGVASGVLSAGLQATSGTVPLPSTADVSAAESPPDAPPFPPPSPVPAAPEVPPAAPVPLEPPVPAEPAVLPAGGGLAEPLLPPFEDALGAELPVAGLVSSLVLPQAATSARSISDELVIRRIAGPVCFMAIFSRPVRLRAADRATIENDSSLFIESLSPERRSVMRTTMKTTWVTLS